MAQTLLQLVDQAYAELALGPVPATVIGNTNLDVISLLNQINGVGQQLVREHPWQALDIQYRFTTVFYSYTGTTTSGSTTLSALSSTTGLTATPTYFAVSGSSAAVPTDTMLVSVNGGASTAVMSQAATASGSTTLTFSQVIYDLPSGYDRLIDDTEWDKTMRWRLIGPSSPQGWQWLKSGEIATGPRTRFRILADKFQIYPPLSDNRYFGFEYLSNFWAATSASAAPTKAAFTVDTDTCIYNDRLMIESLKMRYAMAGAMTYITQNYSPTERQRGFPMAILSDAKTADAGNPMLTMGGRSYGHLIDWNNIPDGYYNL